MLTLTKRYDDLPAAHRQPHHLGHCRYIHGHNYSVELTFCAHHRDENGFIIDFGKLKSVHEELKKLLDHTLLISQDDPQLDTFEDLNLRGLCDLRVLPEGTSAEAMASYIVELVNNCLVSDSLSGGPRVWCSSARLWEDSKDSVTFQK